MAKYKHLPIYKITYELLRRVMKTTKEFAREYKFMLGQKIKEEVVEPLLRLCHDMRINPMTDYAAIVEMTESLGKHHWDILTGRRSFRALFCVKCSHELLSSALISNTNSRARLFMFWI